VVLDEMGLRRHVGAPLDENLRPPESSRIHSMDIPLSEQAGFVVNFMLRPDGPNGDWRISSEHFEDGAM